MEPGGVPEVLRAAGVTRREAETFRLVAERLDNQEIAERLHVSKRTVESHVSSLLRKLGGTTRRSLVELGAQQRDTGFSPLPRPLSTFIGREQQLAELTELTSTQRLVTLTGPPGAGKTRLALQLAASRMPTAVLIDLAASSPATVERAFADALGVESAGRAALRGAVADTPLWLLVDNCEHVTSEAADLVADLLTTTSTVSVLATSQGPLHVTGEVVYAVPTLELARAAQLFLDRAGSALPDFEISPATLRDITTICERLDGLPLAIELAAARIRSFSPAELLAHLDDRFAVLTDGPRGPTTRHRALEHAVRWSYDLLDRDQQLLLERCSVFPAGFDYDTAVAVLAYPPLAADDIARHFPYLVDRSLIAARRRGRATEYRLLDSIRLFAHRQLAQPYRARSEHARHHLTRAVELVPDLQGRDQDAALSWLVSRRTDLDAAMYWTLENGDSHAAWEFFAGIGLAWEILGHPGWLFAWLDDLLGKPLPSGPLGTHAAATLALQMWHRDPARAAAFAAQAAESADDDTRPVADLALGWTRQDDNPDEAIQLLERAASGVDPTSWTHALALVCLGAVVPDAERALELLTQAATDYERLGDQIGRASSLYRMAELAVRVEKHLEAAVGWIDDAQQIAARNGHQLHWPRAELVEAELALRLNQDADHADRFVALRAEFRRLLDWPSAERCDAALARIAQADQAR
ncbi:LuxR C-terminal-related transcriptional regulator [Kribbella sp. NBC_01505]|uniref:ATP-binding protein n=1 Tax=Kribbella sp. NBC_01505 TaxID=2903580 RepID=UPI00386F30D2